MGSGYRKVDLNDEISDCRLQISESRSGVLVDEQSEFGALKSENLKSTI
jgi:hypothetical protein